MTYLTDWHKAYIQALSSLIGKADAKVAARQIRDAARIADKVMQTRTTEQERRDSAKRTFQQNQGKLL